MPLDGFEDDGHGEAETAIRRLVAASAFEAAGGIRKGGFHLFHPVRITLNEVEIGDVAETPDQQPDQVAVAGGGVNFEK